PSLSLHLSLAHLSSYCSILLPLSLSTLPSLTVSHPILFLSFSVPISLSLTHSLPLPLSLPLSLSLSLPVLFLSLSLRISLSLTLSLPLPLSLPPSLSLSHSLSNIG